MIKFEEAYKIMMNHSERYVLKCETVDLLKSLNRVLSEDIISDMNMPPFDKAAMDGYACRKEDIHNELEVIEIVAAGQIPQKEIGKNEAAKIMTGAMLPKGADAIIIVENTQEIAPNRIKNTKIGKNLNICQVEIDDKPNLNICYVGEDVKAGEIVLTKGKLIKPEDIAILASVGCVHVPVSKQIRVAIIATGSELVEPHQKPSISQIRNSNSVQLVAQLSAMGAIASYIGIADDVEEATQAIINKAISENDVILLTGGVSMGDFDLVPAIVEKTGFEILFHHLAVQPGKPTLLAVKDDKFLFGLPGNPVSAFTQFELLTKPLIYKMMGHNFEPLPIKMPLAATYLRKKDNRKSWIPVQITKNGTVQVVSYHGSAHINALSFAHGLIVIEIGQKEILEGTLVDVRLY